MALSELNRWSGHVGVSTDAWGDTYHEAGIITAFVPPGATVLAAYLYTAVLNAPTAPTCRLNGTAVSFGSLSEWHSGLASARADVTAIVSAVVDSGPGGLYEFTVTEGNTAFQDGEVLVVVYESDVLPSSTVVIFDGFAENFTPVTVSSLSALQTAEPWFFAEMRVGISFSNPNTTPPQTQRSTIKVNGLTISTNAGGNDDGTPGNGGLITVGGWDDPFSPVSPSYDDDHERYNIAPYLVNGATSFTFEATNLTIDDLRFLAVFHIATAATPIIGSTVFGVHTTVTAGRAFAVGLDGNANVHDEEGKFKIFGDFEVTGDVTVGGNTLVVGGGVSLDDLADVALVAPRVGSLLRYNGSAWTDAGSEGATQWVDAYVPSAAVMTLRATPATVVPAPGAGYLLEFVGGVIFHDAAVAFTETSDNLVLRYENGSGAQVSEPIETTGFIDQSTDTMTTIQPLADVIVAKAGCENKAIVLHNTGDGEFASGTGALRVKVAYRLWRTDWEELIPTLVPSTAPSSTADGSSADAGGSVLPPA